MDVKTIFLHGYLDKKIYMKQHEGFIKNGNENLVCLLKKSLFGIKKAPRQCYKKFHNFMIKIEFERCDCDYVLN